MINQQRKKNLHIQTTNQSNPIHIAHREKQKSQKFFIFINQKNNLISVCHVFINSKSHHQPPTQQPNRWYQCFFYFPGFLDNHHQQQLHNLETRKRRKFPRKFAIQTERIIKIKNNQKNKQTKQNSWMLISKQPEFDWKEIEKKRFTNHVSYHFGKQNKKHFSVSSIHLRA